MLTTGLLLLLMFTLAYTMVARRLSSTIVTAPMLFIGFGFLLSNRQGRKNRMSEAERKAAALPPKLTVPMILFFLPCLFVILLGPAAIQVMAQM